MENAIFSIITVTRNNLAGLRRTFASLDAQQTGGFEWIVIDGASTDGTAEFLQQTSALTGDALRITSEPDTGIYDAMNKGIAQARGFYLLFLNAGDELADDTTLSAIAATLQQLQETPDFIYGDALEAAPGEPPYEKPARPYKKAAQGMFTHHQAMLYRRDLIGNLRYDTSYKIAADYKFTLEFLKRGKTVLYCPFPLCLFESGGLSQQQATLGRAEQIRARSECGTVPPLQNRLIALRQLLAWKLRTAFPSLYWKLKSR